MSADAVSSARPSSPAIAFTGAVPPAGAPDEASVLALGVREGAVKRAPKALRKRLDRALGAGLARAGETVIVRGGPSAWIAVILVGLGASKRPSSDDQRAIGRALAGAAADLSAKTLVADLPLAAEATCETALAARLAAYIPVDFRAASAAKPPNGLHSVVMVCDDLDAVSALWPRYDAEAAGVELARSLCALPANRLTPDALAAEALAIEGVNTILLREAGLKRARMGLHLAVGQGSVHGPILAVLRWRGAPDPVAPTALVGKGVTFDAGGLCVKPAKGMETMKEDMSGAAAVIGAIYALARMSAPVNVTGVLALAENMAGGGAYRPGDVLTSRAGLTVEVIDTDAEGRMALADALRWAWDVEKPARLLDLATLTGAIVTALGDQYAGLFSADGALREALVDAGEATGEKLWPMPIPGEESLVAPLRSTIADLRQCAPGGRMTPDALHAAWFLRQFLPPDAPHAHLDIAGVTRGGAAPKGPNGFGVRLLIRFLLSGKQ